MTRPTLSFPYALISNTLGTILVSVTAVWLVTSIYSPSPTSHLSGSSHHLFRLSPIPPGADWTA
jgi:hypothetical protein